MVLCHQCDWDAHGTCSVSVSHHRTPVEGFTGCPSASQLASIWGFDFEDKKFKLDHSSSSFTPHWDDCSYSYNYNPRDLLMPVEPWVFKSDGTSLQDLLVPDHNAMDYDAFKKHTPSCGKHKLIIYKQLVELSKRNFVASVGDDVDGGDTAPQITTAGDTEMLVPQAETASYTRAGFTTQGGMRKNMVWKTGSITFRGLLLVPSSHQKRNLPLCLGCPCSWISKKATKLIIVILCGTVIQRDRVFRYGIFVLHVSGVVKKEVH